MLKRISRLVRIVRETNLDAIREQAEKPLPTLIVAESDATGASIVSLLVNAGNALQPSAWLALPDRVGPILAREPIQLAILVSDHARMSNALNAARDELVARRVPFVTVLTSEGAETIARRLFDAVGGDRRIALARQFPGLREPLFTQIIDETARANAGYSFGTGLAEIVPLLDVPLNVGDIIVLTKNQLLMAYRLALGAGKEGRPMDVMGEVIGVVGGGLMFRQIARELIGLVPVIGIVPKVAVAYAGTWAIGRAVASWATGGEKATTESLRHLYAAGLERGRQVARQLTSRWAA